MRTRSYFQMYWVILQCLVLLPHAEDNSNHFLTRVEDENRVRQQSQLYNKCSSVSGMHHFTNAVMQAQTELGVHNRGRFTITNDNKKLFEEFFSANYGARLFSQQNGSLAYATIFKGNSEHLGTILLKHDEDSAWNGDIKSRMKLLAEAQRLHNRSTMPIIYTFVRDPLSHFVAGIVESYTRKYMRRSEPPSSQFNQKQINQSYATYSKAKNIITGVVNFDKKILLKYLVQRIHYGNQMHELITFQPDHIGHLENATSDWTVITALLGVADKATSMNEHGQNHPSSSGDVLGLKNSLRELFEQEPKYLRAVCRLILIDYQCIRGYALPFQCKDMLSDYDFQ